MNLFRRFWSTLFVLGVVSTMAFAAAPAIELRSFTATSLVEIKQRYAGRPFVLAFWSVTCEPCREEMMVVVDAHRKFPHVPIVLVAADPPGTRPAVIKFLETYRLGRIETWQFSDDAAERLRYAVDKSWVGELPRSYFFNARHEAAARSGVVDVSWLETWLKRETVIAPEAKRAGE